MKIPKRVYMLGHHLDVFVDGYPDYKTLQNWMTIFSDSDSMFLPHYDTESIDKILDFNRSLAKNPDTEIEIIEAGKKHDSVCGCCSKYNKIGKRCSEQKSTSKDVGYLDKVELNVGNVLTVSEAIERLTKGGSLIAK